ncbi:Heme transport protein (fragment) [Shewanella benthica]|uniref:Heme transport protein n=1 Tax=Shewanella benthica TaxID=43661 RepID=A0A330M120_9GAMM
MQIHIPEAFRQSLGHDFAAKLDPAINDQTMDNSGSERTSGLMKFGWEPSEGQRLQLSGCFSDTDELVPSNPTQNAHLDLNATLYWNGTDYDEDRVTRGQIDSTEYETIGFSVNNSSIFGATRLIYGIDGYLDTIKTVRDDSGQTGQRPNDIDGKTRVWGAFAKANIGLIDTLLGSCGALRYVRE